MRRIRGFWIFCMVMSIVIALSSSIIAEEIGTKSLLAQISLKTPTSTIPYVASAIPAINKIEGNFLQNGVFLFICC